MAPPALRPTRFAVTPREAVAHGLAPLGFAIARVPPSLIATRFPAAGTLAVFSGPPGGRVGVLVEADGLSGGDATTLREALRTAPAPRIGADRVLSAPEPRSLGGVTLGAVAMLAGSGRSRTHYCVVVVPTQEGAARGLLAWFYGSGQGITTPSCDGVFAEPVLAAAAEGFTVFAPSAVAP